MKKEKLDSAIQTCINQFIEQEKRPASQEDIITSLHALHPNSYTEGEIIRKIETLESKGFLQRAWRKEGFYPKDRYAPIHVSIPIEKREWITDEEHQEQVYKAFTVFEHMKEEERAFIELSVKREEGNRRNIERWSHVRNKEFKRFQKVIQWYLPLFTKKEQEVCILLWGLRNQMPFTLDKIALVLNEQTEQIRVIRKKVYQRIEELTLLQADMH